MISTGTPGPQDRRDHDAIVPTDYGGAHHAPRPRSPAEALQPRRPPEPPEREPRGSQMHPVLRVFNRLMTVLLLLGGLLLGGYYFVKYQFDRPGPLEQTETVVIPQGRGVSAIAEQLETEGVITDRRIFTTAALYFARLKHGATLKAGEYEIAPGASMRQVLDQLVEGKTIRHKVTVAEGLTSQQVVEKLLAEPELTGEITEIPPEGSLLPDTYLFGRGETRQEILNRMQQAQREFLAEHWPQRDPDIFVKTPEEALVLASIVEKETGVPEERPRIAAVFENRLRKNMRLQSDPTIIYGLVGGRGSLGRPILQSELNKKTAYNTYQISGLPPTPIANPGRDSIVAVLNPAKSDDLYFVADGTGGHAFADSLTAHNDNVAAWRRIQKAQREAEEAAKAAGASEPNAASTDIPAPGELLGEKAAAAAEAEAAAIAAAGGTPPLPVRNPKLQ